MDADIRCLRSRLVGGIAGENDGTIENCWVSGIVLSNWQESLSSYTAKVGGICGQNDGTVAFCCVTAVVQNHDADVGGIVGYNSGGCTINHCTFYGEVSSVHSQDNEYVGDQNGNLWNQHSYDDLSNDAILRNYLNSFSGYDLYRYAVQYPYTVNVSNNGYGALEATAPGARQGKTVTLRKAYGSSVESITVQDPWGRNLSVSGNANSGYTFTMPRCDVTVSVRFSGNSLLSAHKGSASDPYTIGSSDDWNAFAYYVNHGNNFSGKYVKLTKDITISKTVGLGKESIFSERPFSGTFGADDPVGIKEIEDGRLKIENEAGAWFTLDGRKIVNSKSSNRKLNRGVYINNGKKFVK